MKALAVLATLVFGFILSTPLWAQPSGSSERPHAASASVSADHVAQHMSMTEQMRAMGVDSRMADEMWAGMRDGSHIAAEEHAQAQLDLMLARG